MPAFFPRSVIEIRLEEPRAFRRLSYSLFWMALLTGIVLRGYRAIALTSGANSWLYLGGTAALGIALLLGMATAHLANYPLHQWLWRAPAFAALAVSGEMLASAILIQFGAEPNGTVRASFSDWPAMAWRALLIRGLLVTLWGLLLAGVVSFVRRRFVPHDDEPEERPAP
jgi:hypothetical protein